MGAGRMTREELLEAIRQEAIETILVAMPDWYGRLLGKRHRRALLRGERRRARHACLRLPARVRHGDGPGAGLRLHELGERLRRRPLPSPTGTRFAARRGCRTPRSCSATSSRRRARPVEVSPRRILQRQVERAERDGLRAERRARSSSSTSSAKPTTRRGRSTATTSCRSAATSRTITCSQGTEEEPVIGAIAARSTHSGVPVEWQQGRVGTRAAGDQPRVRRAPGAGGPQRDLQARRQGDRLRAGHSR